MRLLLFLGAGSSVELGVPAMREMAEQFHDHLRDTGLVADEIIKILAERLDESAFDIESIIDELDKLVGAQHVAPKWGVTAEGHRDQFTTLRNEAEWFVQHACERINPVRARHMWVPILGVLGDHIVTLATTNYDRAIEIGAAELKLSVTDGFGSLREREYVPWSGFNPAARVKMLKLHGSTDWYRAHSDQQVYKLRDPMALFGPVTLNLEDIRLAHAIVLPSREKRSTESPYQEIAFEFRKEAEHADVAVFLGTSLRDPPLLSLCDSVAKRIPTFAVSRHPDRLPPVLTPKVVHIAQSASRFLVSSLPRALRSADKADFVETLKSERTATGSILDPLATACDKARPCDARCQAIEQLAAPHVALPKATVEPLLRDEHAEVSTYALALIQDSPDADDLVQLARSVADGAPGSDFAQETQLLLELLGST